MIVLPYWLRKVLYPVYMTGLRKTWRGKRFDNTEDAKPLTSIYRLEMTDNHRQQFPFSRLQGKKIMIVNTASDCGFVEQYHELQKLYIDYFDKLVIIVFPSNDFDHQEQGSDEQIAAFCDERYAATFPIMSKSMVLKGDAQNSIYQWLTHAEENGWNNHPPDWNFGKYLIDEQGKLMHYFGTAISPFSKEVLKAINQ
ncbi:MAG: glutathione peroxidase [Sphingobacteriales bacterium]|nr:MAG: glutathione peroxidase [Sphingobacteriales bacterium]